jgi:hypothetical protein
MRFLSTLRLLAVFTALFAGWFAFGQQPVDPDHAAKVARGLEIFKSVVRPVLAERCLKCHGGKDTEAGLDLSDRDRLLRGGDSGPAIIVGRAKDSLIVKLLQHAKEPKMPKGSAKLPEETLKQIIAWIDSGAPYDKPLIEKADPKAWITKKVEPELKKHWAYQPLNRVEPPVVKDEAWCRTPIDRFIRARQEQAGIAPNGPADRRKLIRRAYFDVIGLPPAPEEVEAFVNDRSPDAWEKVIDGLLKSPHYGERWGRHWLDLVRFAESHGYEHDYDRPTAYHYRDFVIKALNDNLPFDTFVKWQLAGDEYAPDNPLAWMATGYLAAGVHSTQITKNEVERHRYDEMDDMLATTSTAFLGLTVGCCRCHDHKYDPFPQADYYRLLSTFTTTVRSEYELDLDPAGYKKALAAFDAAHKPLVQEVEKFEKEQLPARFAEWEKTKKALPPSWIIPEPKQQRSAGGATVTKQDDGSALISGTNPPIETLVFTYTTGLKDIRAIRIEALTHPSLVKNGPGRAANGNFALTDLKVVVSPVAGEKRPPPTQVKLKNARATFEQKGLPVAAAIDADPVTSGWAIDPQFGKDHAAAFEFESPVGFDGGTAIGVTMTFSLNVGHGMGRPRISFASDAKLPLNAPAVAESFKTALDTPAEKRTPEQKKALLKWYAPLDSQWQALNAKVQAHLKKMPQPNKVKALVSSEGVPALRLHTQGDDFLPQTHFLRRGDVDQKDAIAPQAFLQVLMPAAEASSKWQHPAPPGRKTSFRRTALAEWMTDTQAGAGGLVARVIVNRLWQHHLGRGLVATPSDFGSRGDPPTHPELLDWLATELIQSGWKLKTLHKLILTSAVYMQDSQADEARLKIDRDNKLCWRHAGKRLEAEVIRDSLLALGGALDPTMFGPGTLDEASRRRSIYFTVKRSKLIGMMVVFDAPEALVGVADRPATTIAPQALMMMNNPHVREWANGFAKRFAPTPQTADDAAVRNAYLLALSRPPTSEELADGAAFLKGQADLYGRAGKANARELALADFAQAVMCLNEVVLIE